MAVAEGGGVARPLNDKKNQIAYTKYEEYRAFFSSRAAGQD
jgi:hypothetical protein